MPNRQGNRAALVLAGVAAAGVSALALARYRRDIRLARERVAAGSAIAATACGPVEYATAGEGPPALVVHGAGGGYDQGVAFATPLAARGVRVIAMSRFGYLRTPVPQDASPAAQADAHACLLDALGIERAAIVGASAGAPSSLQFALRHPARCSALALLVPAAYAPRPGAAPPLTTPPWTALLFDTALRSDFLFWAAMQVAPRVVTRSILATPLSVVKDAKAEEQARVKDTMRHILPISPRRAGLLNDARVTTTLERYELERISVRTLVIGVRDCLYGTFEPARYTAAHIPGARFIGYETGGHLWVGHQQDVVAGIADFLRGSAR